MHRVRQAEIRGLRSRHNYMQSVQASLGLNRSVLPSTNARAITQSNNPVKQSMSMSFGHTLTQPRKLLVPGGVITAVMGQTTIRCAETVKAVTAFVRTNYPYGGKVGGIKYSLVGFIPRVIKALPGSVTINT